MTPSAVANAGTAAISAKAADKPPTAGLPPDVADGAGAAMQRCLMKS